MIGYKFNVESETRGSDINAIVAGLLEYNALHTAGDMPKYLVVTLRNEQGELIGGLVGTTYLGWLHVQALWLPEGLRRQGHGKSLLGLAEQEAIQRGCPRVFLETLSFQSLGFYERQGYKVIGQVPDFPPGGTRYALTKMLSDPDLDVGA